MDELSNIENLSSKQCYYMLYDHWKKYGVVADEYASMLVARIGYDPRYRWSVI